ncbi:MAG: M28 family peptidase [Nitrosospira sp.]|nr:M28 family peptidase [Nitrosospira sp.]
MHYDTGCGLPGANDNGSAIAAFLRPARAYAGKQFSRTLRFVAFTKEESPFTR